MFDELSPFGGHVWSILLLGSSMITVHGLAADYSRVVAFGSILGYLAWIMVLISWAALSGGSYLVVPLVSIPMIAFFMFVHLKHSIIQKWEDQNEEV